MVDYVGRIYRPPSEARSFLLQVTVGCSHNRCSYCDMYRDKQFRPKEWATIEADLQEAARVGPRFRRVFLCDGDALILPTRKLLRILEGIREHLPWVERVGTYGDTRSVGRKPVEELTALREAGLGIVYHGMESGDDETLRRIDKGGTAAECVETAGKLREAGLAHSVMVLLGVGGRDRSHEHAQETAKVLTKMDPPFVGALTTTVVPGTPLAAAQARGEFALPEKFAMLQELREIVAGSEFSACRFSANHASNYLPLTADLPQQKRELVGLLDRVLEAKDERLLKPEGLRGL
ncbi:radical SAM protein [Paraliomyxa miuraensis]|uniref:radical SAM protein n=1 Tax=Paraliomyxa miuraensis TaxID=376150 RepID=UPI00225229FF|nr:radical SAM protein [Paraliomyxa miuraensis]MCX4240744.1 radical SAM protein [Paraliomyxa miuraensis]